MAKIFISYSRADRQFIEQFIPLIRRVYGNDSLWFDQEIHGGTNWWQMILNEIHKCDLFIYLVSNESIESPYCQAELREALRLNKQVLPVIVRRLKPNYLNTVATDLASFLKKTQYVDMSGGFRDPDTLSGLYASLARLLTAPQSTVDPVTITPTPEPPVPDKKEKDSSTRVAYIGGIFLLVSVVIAGIFGLWQGVFSNQNPTPTPPTQVALNTSDELTSTPDISPDDARATGVVQAYGTLTALAPTDTPTITPTPTDTPISSSDIQLTARAEVFATETSVSQTQAVIAQETQNAVLTEQFRAGATLTQSFQLSLTPLPTHTLTPEPIVNPALLDIPEIALTPVARNRDWIPIERGFQGVPMVLVPVGCFMMGDNGVGGEQCFDRPFWIDKTEVTQADFSRLNGVQESLPWFRNSSYPVENITWFEASNFCQLRGGRLPTEAEWEYVARGPDGLLYPWGNVLHLTWGGSSYAVWRRSSEFGMSGTDFVGIRPDGMSWVGAFDMSGNVWEWTSSLYETYPYNKFDGRERDTGNNTDFRRVIRGGAWNNNNVNILRSIHRSMLRPNISNNNTGFRCVLSY